MKICLVVITWGC